MEKIYVDYAATSPVHPKVMQVIYASMEETFGNPSSIHFAGRKARQLLDKARQICATSIGATTREITFTSGGTESNNLAIFGVAYANRHLGNHIITSKIEHDSVLEACRQLEKDGFLVTYLDVDISGQVLVEDVANALTEETILVSIMLGNNEVGTIQPIREVGQLLTAHQASFHTDAVQAYGLLPIDVADLQVDLLSVSAHKINGPKGTGFLYMKEKTKVHPRVFGGEQERKKRAGTENLHSIVGFGEAVQIAMTERETKSLVYEELRKVFLETLKVAHEVNTPLDNSLPHILHVSFAGADVESFLINLDMAGVAASSGSACTAGSLEPSHVLVAMFGEGAEQLRSSVRFSFGLGNTIEQVREVANRINKILKK